MAGGDALVVLHKWGCCLFSPEGGRTVAQAVRPGSPGSPPRAQAPEGATETARVSPLRGLEKEERGRSESQA